MKIEKLLKNLKAKRVILMPDFFLDHMLYWEGSLGGLMKPLEEVTRRKGGNVHVGQDLALGGCAAKTAWVFGLLGLRPIFLT